MPIWEVELYVYGPITVTDNVNLNELKGLHPDDPFYSEITLRPVSSGVIANVTARAENDRLALRAALFFFGQMLDVLSFNLNLRLRTSLFAGESIRTEINQIRRRVGHEEWHSAFEGARSLSQNEPTFLRAIGWYRKGLYTEDPFDKFLALWNSIEIAAGKYHPKSNRTRSGVKNQIWACFNQLWGDIADWPIISGDQGWIEHNYETRKDIAHGIKAVDVSRVEAVVAQIEPVREVAHAFLMGWVRTQLADHPILIPTPGQVELFAEVN